MIVWRRSLTLRLVSLFVAVTAILLIGLGWITMASTDRHFVELDETYLRDKGVLIHEIGRHSHNAQELVQRIRSTMSTQTGLSIELVQDAHSIYRSANFQIPADVQKNLLAQSDGDVKQWQSGPQTLRGIAVTIPLAGQSADHKIVAIIAVDIEHHDHFMTGFRRLIWLYVCLAILAGGLLAWWVARKGLRPLRPIIDQTERISASQLSSRIPTMDVPMELEPLVQTLNQMLQRLEDDFSRLSAFSSELAHELRTPISNMLVQSQVTLGKERSVQQYQEVLLSMVEELERLSHMVADMLYLAQTEHHVQLPRRQSVDLNEQARELAEFYGLMAEEKDVLIQVSGVGNIHGDRLMIRRAISNLISNAIRHASQSSRIDIDITAQTNQTSISVTNVGESIAPENIPKIFDRFFQVEEPHTHQRSDGVGLGLTITQAVMAAHDGSIEVSSTQGRTTFRLVFPNP